MIKAIETEYNGYRFRSRLEARWAVFFTTAGIKYEYEKEGCDLDGVRYLPDFHLPEQKCYIEVKGQKPTDDEIKKMELLAAYSFEDVHIFYGEIEIPRPGHFYEKVISQMVRWPPEYGAPYFPPYLESESGWAQCPWCLSFGITYHSNLRRLPCKCFEYIERFLYQEPLRTLLNHCPDIIKKEPMRGSEYAQRPLFFRLSIHEWWRNKCNDLMYAGDSPLLIKAYTAARQARFEHGERP